MDDISVAKIGSPSSPIRILLREYEGHRFVDVRRYYIDRSTKEAKPTKKGITLNARALSELRDVFERSEKEMSDWLEGDTTAETDTLKRQMLERQNAADRSARKEKPHTITSRKWRLPTFFACSSDGDRADIALNENHDFVRKLRQTPVGREPDAQVKAVGAMLAAYYHTKSLFDDLEEVKAAQFFEAFEYEWGLILSNYSSAEK